MPSKRISAAYIGSEQATMRSTSAPLAMTAASWVNSDISALGKANSIAPEIVISPTLIISTVRLMRSSLRSSRSPSAFPHSVEAAASMPKPGM